MNDSPGTAMARPSATSLTDSALGTTSEFSQELAPTAAAEAAKQEVQAAVILAKRFPRNEDDAYSKIIKACKRPTFAEDAEYSFPRGGSKVHGPSIYLAREFARVWGNIRHGCDVITDSDDERTIRAWAWDLETNVKVTSDVTFKKLVQRKKNNDTVWIKPDERDLRELTNKHAAISKRNCLLELLPSDMVEDACNQANKTLKDRAAADPDATRKAIVTNFADLNVPITGLEKYLGHPIGESSPEELANLRTIYKSIKDGNSKWSEYVNGNSVDSDDLAKKTRDKAEEMKAKISAKGDEATELNNHVDASPYEQAAADEEPDAIDAEEVEMDAVATLRANLQAALEELPKTAQKNVMQGKPFLKDMSIDELNQLAIDIRKAE